MKDKNTGFVDVKEVHDGWTIVSLCHDIENRDFNKAKDMCEKIRKFFSKHKDIGYIDYHWGNIMENEKGEYVITDIDLNMVSVDYMMKDYNDKKLKDLLNTRQKTGWNPYLYMACLNEHKIKITVYNITMIALNFFEISNFETFIILTPEIVDKVVKMKNYE